jgi:hypothetical protein
VRPAYLELREVAPDTYDVLWKVPARGSEERLAVYVRLPTDVEQLGEVRAVAVGGAYIERWRIRRPGGLAGQTIGIDGLAATSTDVLFRLTSLDGSVFTSLVRPSRPWVDVAPARGPWSVAGSYLVLGVEHIWGGIDHLLFVAALLLLVRGWRRVVATVTAFTVAHSVTLAAATLGLLHIPPAPVEATIALSIVFVAGEIVRARQGRPGLAERAPYLVAFTFGLLHGLGFAGALREVGLPHGSVPAALLFFNVGVEVGQLLFIAAALAAVALARRLARALAVTPPSWAWRLPPYAIGVVAVFWVLERILAL